MDGERKSKAQFLKALALYIVFLVMLPYVTIELLGWSVDQFRLLFMPLNLASGFILLGLASNFFMTARKPFIKNEDNEKPSK